MVSFNTASITMTYTCYNLRRFSFIPDYRRLELRPFYRSLQVLHHSCEDVWNTILPLLFPILEGSIIVYFYSAIRFRKTTQMIAPLILVGLSIEAMFAMHAGITLCVRITELTSRFSQKAYSREGLTKEEEKWVKSCRGLNWNIGPLFLSRVTFPNI